MANLNIKLVKSLNGRLEKHIATANSMGLRKIGVAHIAHLGGMLFALVLILFWKKRRKMYEYHD